MTSIIAPRFDRGIRFMSIFRTSPRHVLAGFSAKRTHVEPEIPSPLPPSQDPQSTAGRQRVDGITAHRQRTLKTVPRIRCEPGGSRIRDPGSRCNVSSTGTIARAAPSTVPPITTIAESFPPRRTRHRRLLAATQLPAQVPQTTIAASSPARAAKMKRRSRQLSATRRRSSPLRHLRLRAWRGPSRPAG